MFIGDKKINAPKSVPDEIEFNVQFEDGIVVRMTKKMFEASVSEVPLDASALQDRRAAKVAGDILKLLLEWDIEMGDLKYILDLTYNSTVHWKEECEELLWQSKVNQIKLSKVNEVLDLKNKNNA